MNKIASQLKLKPEATEDEIVAAISALQNQNDLLSQDNEQMNGALKDEGVDPQLEKQIQSKITAGLSRADAIQVINNQAAEDAAAAKAEKKTKK